MSITPFFCTNLSCPKYNCPGLYIALPFSTLETAISRRPTHYPDNPKTIGEHLLKFRIDLQLTKRAVAKQIGVTPSTIGVWEKGTFTPDVAHMKNVIDFLGYYPLEEPTTLGGRIQKYRYIHGLSLEEFGVLVDADGATVWSWENGKFEPLYNTRKRIEVLLKE